MIDEAGRLTAAKLGLDLEKGEVPQVLVPKGMIFDIMQEINKCSVEAPVKMGQVIIPNVLGTGVDVVATRTMPAE